MSSNPEIPERRAQPFLHALPVAAIALALLAGCSANIPLQPAQEPAVAVTPPQQSEAERIRTSPPAPVVSKPQPADAVAQMLTYAERLRVMPPNELSQELLRLGDAPASAGDQLRLSLLLSQLRQLPELIRAQELLARVLGNAEAQELHPLARLLAARYAEQRRVEEQLDKQNQQVRDIQRRLDQTNERLEALKAIERSLAARPAPPPVAPASAPTGNRNRAPASQ